MGFEKKSKIRKRTKETKVIENDDHWQERKTKWNIGTIRSDGAIERRKNR